MTNDRSAENPYAIPNLQSQPFVSQEVMGPLKVSINVVDTIRRGWDLVSGQYWMLLVIIFVGVLIGSLVPMNILMGAMMVGIFLCIMQVERGETVEFNTLFKSFDQFVDSLIVIICVTVLSFVVMIPLILVFLGMLFATIPAGQEPGPGFFVAVFSIVPLAIGATFIIYLPFLFCFQLIADKKMAAIDAIKFSCRAVWINLAGISLFLVAIGFLSMLLTMMCYIPGILFLPISTASFWVLYRDIFPEPIVEASLT